MSQQSKISIIIPVYNAEKYLRKCLDSVINQTYENIEIICVNDGSKDDSLKILNEYQKKYNKLIIIDKKNEGVSAARNDGIRKATGEYITFVDSDDWLELDTIESLYNALVEQKVDVVRGNYFINIEYEKNKTIGNLKNLKNQKLLTSENDFGKLVMNKLLNGQIPCYVVLLLIKKDIALKTSLFREDIAFMEDVIFYLELMTKIESIYFLYKPLYHYYCNQSSSTKSSEYHIRNIYNVLKTNKHIEEIIKSSKFNEEERLEIRRAFNAKTIMSYLYAMYISSKSQEDFVKNVDKLLNDSKIYNLLSLANLELLPQNIKMRIEKYFLNLVVNKRYERLMMLYKIRKKLGG